MFAEIERSEIVLNFCRSKEATKKLKPLIPSGNEFGDCVFIDDEEDIIESTLDQPMPTSSRIWDYKFDFGL